MNLTKKVRKTIKKYSMLQQEDRVLIGLSGGPDSVCLAVALHEIKDSFDLSLHALYVNHGLRPEESREEEDFCRRFCDGLGIDFYVESIDVKEHSQAKKLNLQEAARELRYDVFERTALKIGADQIALAHSADDQAETVLMRLLRGAGRKGLSGIPPVRRLGYRIQSSPLRNRGFLDKGAGKLGNNKSIFIIRPLIEVQRQEIEEHLLQNSEFRIPNSKVPFMVDSSNLKKDYSRNWLRLEVIPLLKEQNPSFVESVNRTAEVLRDEDEYLEIATTKTMMRLITRKTDKMIELFLVPLMNIEKSILRRVFRRALAEIGADRGIELVHIDDIIRLVRESNSGDMINLPKGIRAVKKYSTLLITRELPAVIKTQNIDIPGEINLDGCGLTLISELTENKAKYDGSKVSVFDYDSLTLPLKVRSRDQGDYFYPSGLGGKKKLQDFFVDEKVPRETRDSVPVIVSGEDIIWIAGYRMDERHTAKEGTKKYLVLRIVSS